MNVFIARDGQVLGEYPHAELEAMARGSELQTDDHYWFDGMEDWEPLPDLLGWEAWEPPEPPSPPLPPLNPRTVFAVIAAAAVIIAIAGFFLIPPHRSMENRASAGAGSLPMALDEGHVLRDKAAAELRQKIERLPARATPPLNTFYYDVRVNMSRTLSIRTPWTATMRGGENLVDPKTQETVVRTAFTLQADYENGVWVYKHYHASASNIVKDTTTEIEEDENSPAPPSIVGMLGLKQARD